MSRSKPSKYLPIDCYIHYAIQSPRKRHLRQPNCSKGLTKLVIILDYKPPWMLCLALQPGQKSGLILPFYVIQKLNLQKKSF